jgi:hypothetical protein
LFTHVVSAVCCVGVPPLSAVRMLVLQLDPNEDWKLGPRGHVLVQVEGSATRQSPGAVDGVAEEVVPEVRVVNVEEVLVMESVLVREVDVDVVEVEAHTTFCSRQVLTLAGVSPICRLRQVPARVRPVVSRTVNRTVLQATTFVARFIAPPDAMAAHSGGRDVTQLGLAAAELDAADDAVVVVDDVSVELDCVPVTGDVDELGPVDDAVLLEETASLDDEV